MKTNLLEPESNPIPFGIRPSSHHEPSLSRVAADPDDRPARRWLTVVVFAIAMAWVEAAVVYDIRTMIDRIEPYQAEPLPLIGSLGPVELVRELATLIMLLTVGMLAGRTWRNRIAYSALAFGLWDIFYYIHLKIMCGWPHSLLDWDILFLLPLPWWGPVLAPMLIALLMLVWGTLVTQFERSKPSGPRAWLGRASGFAGALLALYVFMLDCLRVAGQGVEVVRAALPTRFEWPLFSLALLLMALPVTELVRTIWLQKSAQTVAADEAAQGDAASSRASSVSTATIVIAWLKAICALVQRLRFR